MKATQNSTNILMSIKQQNLDYSLSKFLLKKVLAIKSYKNIEQNLRIGQTLLKTLERNLILKVNDFLKLLQREPSGSTDTQAGEQL